GEDAHAVAQGGGGGRPHGAEALHHVAQVAKPALTAGESPRSLEPRRGSCVQANMSRRRAVGIIILLLLACRRGDHAVPEPPSPAAIPSATSAASAVPRASASAPSRSAADDGEDVALPPDAASPTTTERRADVAAANAFTLAAYAKLGGGNVIASGT